MKKLVFAAVAAIALMASVSFVSCDKKAAPATVSVVEDSVVEDSVVVEDSIATDSIAADSIAE